MRRRFSLLAVAMKRLSAHLEIDMFTP